MSAFFFPLVDCVILFALTNHERNENEQRRKQIESELPPGADELPSRAVRHGWHLGGDRCRQDQYSLSFNCGDAVIAENKLASRCMLGCENVDRLLSIDIEIS